MAVQDKYVNAGLVDATRETIAAAQAQGTKLVALVQTFEVAAADDDASIYRVFKGLPATLVPIRISIACDAITSGTDWDVGLYKTNLGAVVDKDILADGIDLSSAVTFASPKDGLKDVAIENRTKMLWELAGQTIRSKATVFDIALTANTVGSAAGTITVIGEFLNP